jgi:hypothetical protein
MEKGEKYHLKEGLLKWKHSWIYVLIGKFCTKEAWRAYGKALWKVNYESAKGISHKCEQNALLIPIL